jgi:hypothetical protein
LGRDDEVFEDAFSYFMEELQESASQFKKYTLGEVVTLVLFGAVQVGFVRHLFSKKQPSI